MLMSWFANGSKKQLRSANTAASHSAAPYVLATGKAAAHRLRMLHDLYGVGTQRLLLEAGIRRGMRVDDVGCGIGTVA